MKSTKSKKNNSRQMRKRSATNYYFSSKTQSLGRGSTTEEINLKLSIDEPALQVSNKFQVPVMSQLFNKPEFTRYTSLFEYFRVDNLQVVVYPRNITDYNNLDLLKVTWRQDATQFQEIANDDNTKIIPAIITRPKIYNFKPPNVLLFRPPNYYNYNQFTPIANLDASLAPGYLELELYKAVLLVVYLRVQFRGSVLKTEVSLDPYVLAQTQEGFTKIVLGPKGSKVLPENKIEEEEEEEEINNDILILNKNKFLEEPKVKNKKAIQPHKK